MTSDVLDGIYDPQYSGGHEEGRLAFLKDATGTYKPKPRFVQSLRNATEHHRSMFRYHLNHSRFYHSTMSYDVMLLGGRSILMLDYAISIDYYEPSDYEGMSVDSIRRCLYLTHLLKPCRMMMDWFSL